MGRLCRSIILFVLLGCSSGVGRAQLLPDIQPGMAPEAVIAAYGWPNGRSATGDREIWMYDSFQVTFQDRRVFGVTPIINGKLQTKRPASGPSGTPAGRSTAPSPLTPPVTSTRPPPLAPTAAAAMAGAPEAPAQAAVTAPPVASAPVSYRQYWPWAALIGFLVAVGFFAARWWAVREARIELEEAESRKDYPSSRRRN